MKGGACLLLSLLFLLCGVLLALLGEERVAMHVFGVIFIVLGCAGSCVGSTMLCKARPSTKEETQTKEETTDSTPEGA